MQRFTIDVPEAVLADLRQRLAGTRFPDQLENAGWSDGTELGYLRELVEYWRDVYDWRAHERALNRHAHWLADLHGLRLHFVHARSPEPDALPLLLTHGWPGSVYEFHKVIGPLTDPVAHGGRREDAFHVVCPSLPGYGWSEAPRRPGFDVLEVAACCAELMARLGYTRYGAQGGDWGAISTAWLGRIDAAHLVGIHLNMVAAGPPAGVADPMAGVSAEEQGWLGEMAAFQQDGTGYQRIQGTRPQTLGYALNDSPAGLAAWIVEKFQGWSDCGGRVESRFSKDELLTNVMIYWVTGSITSSMRLYRETMRSGRFGPVQGRVEVPTAGAIFRRDLYKAPRRWAEAAFNLRRWSVFPTGGHFAALEEPALLVDDVRAFFRELR